MRFVWPIVIGTPLEYRGLARRVWIKANRDVPKPIVPWGWRAFRSEVTPSVMIMPAWLYWPIYFWRYRHWYTLAPLQTMGFYCVREDGGYWVDGWFTWRTWQTFDHIRMLPRCPEARIPYVNGAPFLNRWERVARWLERMVNDWNAKDPNADMRRAGVL